MLFKREMVDAILAGRKTQTRRPLSDNPRSPWWRERCRFQPGKEFGVQGGRGMRSIRRAVVTAVRQERLGDISNDDAAAEGFEAGFDSDQDRGVVTGWISPREAFWRYIRKIHRGKVDEDTLVWVVEFELLERSEDGGA